MKRKQSDPEDLAYPLHWPVGRPRTKQRQPARFATRGYNGTQMITTSKAIDRLMDEMERLEAESVVISTDFHAGSGREPIDPGAVVYFRLRIKGKRVGNGYESVLSEQHALACDRWTRLADNIAAIASHVRAVRGQLRWGVADAAQAFAGFKALPAVGAAKPWWEVLGFQKRPSEAVVVKERFRELPMRHHPDRGGNPNQMAEISAAYTTGIAEVSQ